MLCEENFRLRLKKEKNGVKSQRLCVLVEGAIGTKPSQVKTL